MSGCTRIEDLNKRITLQSSTKVADGMGGLTVTWADVATVWAGVWPISAKEHIEAKQTGITITHQIRIRYRASVTGAYRVLFESRYFNIVSIIDHAEDHEWLDLLCKEAT